MHRKLIFAISVFLLLRCDGIAAATCSASRPENSWSRRGEFGFDLGLLKKHYVGPESRTSSNHFIDLWSEQNLRSFVVGCRLSNNHALFINSHGKALGTTRGTRYAFYPHEKLRSPIEPTPYFSARDIATVVGHASATTIHNIIISGCNTEGAFDSSELRRWFVNATNITHVAAGELGYQVMFLQTLVSRSSDIRPVYETGAKDSSGKVKYFSENSASQNSTKLSPYIAELFKPGARQPFRIQIAGRELLDPGR
jgi:hypothetical protein